MLRPLYDAIACSPRGPTAGQVAVEAAPAKPLEYATIRTSRSLRCRRTPDLIQCVIEPPGVRYAAMPGVDSVTLQGFRAALGFLDGRSTGRGRALQEPARCSLTLTQTELWLVRGFAGQLPERTIYPRSKLLELRAGRYGGGLHLRIEGEHIGSIRLRGGDDVAWEMAEFIVQSLPLLPIRLPL